jgi:hypothetical protein
MEQSQVNQQQASITQQHYHQLSSILAYLVQAYYLKEDDLEVISLAPKYQVRIGVSSNSNHYMELAFSSGVENNIKIEVVNQSQSLEVRKHCNPHETGCFAYLKPEDPKNILTKQDADNIAYAVSVLKEVKEAKEQTFALQSCNRQQQDLSIVQGKQLFDKELLSDQEHYESRFADTKDIQKGANNELPKTKSRSQPQLQCWRTI